MFRMLGFSLLLCLAVTAQEVVSPNTRTLAGEEPGTECWMVTFKTRSFDLLEFRRANLEGAGAGEVAEIVATLEEQVIRDQAPFVRFITGLGGRVKDQWWIVNACCIEIPSAKYETVKDHPRVGGMHVEKMVMPQAPIKNSTNNSNHRTDLCQTMGYLGKGITVAIMDTGLDMSMGTSGRPHRTFFVKGDPNNKTGGGIGGSRVLAYYGVGLMGPEDVSGHGTTVCSVLAGADWKTSVSDNGHLPEAHIVSYGLADNGMGGMKLSTVVTGWQRVAADKAKYKFDVVNASLGGICYAHHPANQALDSLVLNTDVLPVVAAGNGYQSTACSQSCINGLAVGAVSSTAKVMADFSSRGPIFGDVERFYPHLCACGWGVDAALHNDDTKDRNCSGTSIACPQVAGAAAMYRGIKPQASALETKAVILATTEDVSVQNNQPPYNTRNAYGMGFLRSDRVMDAARGNCILINDSLTSATPLKTNLFKVTAGKTYAAVLVWNREDVNTNQWSNLALRVKQGTRVLGVSDTPRNLYEKVYFYTQNTCMLMLEVSASLLGAKVQPYTIVVVEVPSRLIPGSTISYGAGCPGTGKPNDVSVVIPMTYTGKWGDGSFNYILGNRNHFFQQVFDPAEVPPRFTATGMALRQDEKVFKALSNYWAEVSITMGYTTKTTMTMESLHANNVTDPMTAVLTKTKIYVPKITGVNKSSDDFFVKIPFAKPFSYQDVPGKCLLITASKTNSSLGPTNLTAIHLDQVHNQNTYPTTVMVSNGGTSAYGSILKGSGLIIGLLTDFQPNPIPRLKSVTEPRVSGVVEVVLSQAKGNAAVSLFVGFNDAIWSSLALPFDLDFLGAPGCKLRTSVNMMVPSLTNAMGDTRWIMALPSEKTLISSHIYLQALVLDTPANAAGLAITNAIDAMVGGKP